MRSAVACVLLATAAAWSGPARLPRRPLLRRCAAASDSDGTLSRRQLLAAAALSSAAAAQPAAAADSLGTRMAARDAALLTKPILNVPPRATVFPGWLAGDWTVDQSFVGFQFPSKTVKRETLVGYDDVPGFQKLSVARMGDVGSNTTYAMSWTTGDAPVTERFPANLRASLEAYSRAPGAVTAVEYDAANPNRCSVTFKQGLLRNAERIELFCNAREAEAVDADTFVCSEAYRQVTFSLSTEFGKPRQVNTDWSCFWTFKRRPGGGGWDGNVLTAGYLSPLSPSFFDEPTKPVVVYSHKLAARAAAA